jgi:hypothetical protein
VLFALATPLVNGSTATVGYNRDILPPVVVSGPFPQTDSIHRVQC